MPTFDLSISSLRELNTALHQVEEGNNDIHFDILNPRGHHAVAVGIAAHLTVDIKGSVGYYCAGMNDGADIVIHGSAGPGVAENIMSGTVVVEGDAVDLIGVALERLEFLAAGDIPNPRCVIAADRRHQATVPAEANKYH